MPMGGGYFGFSTKTGLKNTENVVFCIPYMPIEKALASPPLATLLPASNTRNSKVNAVKYRTSLLLVIIMLYSNFS